MSINIEILVNDSWERYDDLSIRCFDKEKIHLLKEYTKSNRLLNEINGGINANFSLIYEQNDRLLACVDHIRSIPLFYYLSEEKFIVSDSVSKITSVVEVNFDSDHIKEFLYSGFVLNENTLFHEIKQLEAGQYLAFNKKTKELEIANHFKYQNVEHKNVDTNSLLKELDDVHNSVFQSLLTSVNGKRIVIPLSGGHDSRLIAEMLKRHDYQNILCYSYGRSNNPESQISEKLAKHYGYQWTFVKQSRSEWHRIFQTNSVSEYTRMASNYSSRAHFQDFYAIDHLCKNGILDTENDIIVPGHTGDFIEGAQLRESFNQEGSLDDVAGDIIQKHFKNWEVLPESVINKVYECVGARGKEFTGDQRIALNDWFNWKERQAKIIVNSLRVYDYFNLEWRIPLWDIRLLDYWMGRSFEERFNRSLYNKYYKEYFNGLPSIHGPNRNPFKRISMRILDDWYGIYNGNKPLLPSVFKSVDYYFENLVNLDAEQLGKQPVYSSRKEGLMSLMQLNELLG